MLRRGIGGAQVDHPSNGCPPVQGRVGAAHDFDTTRIVDRQGDDAGLVAGRGLRHTIHEEQGVRELVALAWQASQQHRIEQPEFRADVRAGHVRDGLRERLIAAQVDRGTLDDGRWRRDVSNADRRLRRRDLHLLHEVGGGIELDRELSRNPNVGNPQLEIPRCTDNEHDRAR